MAADDVAALLEIQARRTPEGIASALRVSRDALGPTWFREIPELYAGASSKRDGLAGVVELVSATSRALVRSVAAKGSHGRVRPYDMGVGITSASGKGARGSSFPSTHAAVAHAAAEVLARRGTPAQAVRALGHADEVAAARQYLGVHFPSDVEAGAQMGRAAAQRVKRP